MAKATDEVIIQFLINEEIEMYKLSYGRIDFREIVAEYGAGMPGVISVEIQDKGCTNEVATNAGEEVSAYAIFYTKFAEGFYGGFGGLHYKINISVEKGGDSNSTWKCGMNVTQKAQAYMRPN